MVSAARTSRGSVSQMEVIEKPEKSMRSAWGCRFLNVCRLSVWRLILPFASALSTIHQCRVYNIAAAKKWAPWWFMPKPLQKGSSCHVLSSPALAIHGRFQATANLQNIAYPGAFLLRDALRVGCFFVCEGPSPFLEDRACWRWWVSYSFLLLPNTVCSALLLVFRLFSREVVENSLTSHQAWKTNFSEGTVLFV